MDHAADLNSRQDIYQKLLTASVDGFVLSEIIRDGNGTPVDYRFIEVNPAFIRMTGLISKSLIGRTLLESFPETCSSLMTPFEQAVLTGVPTIFECRSNDVGKYFKISAYLSGADLLAFVVVNITENKLAEQALKGSVEKFRNLVESSFDVIFVLDTTGVFRFVSPAWEKHFGYAVSEILDKSFEPFVHPDDAPLCLEYLVRVMTTGQSATSPPYRVKRADGSWSLFIANGTPYTDEHGNYLYIGVGRDISEQKRAEDDRLELERQLLHSQKLESLGVLAGGIAHDFNNLLQAMQGNMELALIELSPDSAARRYLGHSLNAARHAADLTRRMLAYSGKGHFIVNRLDLNELVSENAAMLRTAVSRTISIDLQTNMQLPAIIADQAQIQQVIMNLITNAAEAIEEQPGFIKLSTGVQNYDRTLLANSCLADKPGPGRFVYLEITDNGIGMSEETRVRIFDPFFTTKFTGRGLGMSAVLGIVKGHGGALFVESGPGKGSSIRVIFPAVDTDNIATTDESGISTAEKGAAAAPPLSGMALVVDDEKRVLDIAVTIVKLCGFSVISARNGMDAVSKFQQHAEEIDVVLMDLTMPNMDGAAAMHELRLIKPDVKIILSSGFNEQELNERIVGQAPSGFIRKPYSMKSLEAELRRVIPGQLAN